MKTRIIEVSQNFRGIINLKKNVEQKILTDINEFINLNDKDVVVVGEFACVIVGRVFYSDEKTLVLFVKKIIN